MDFQEHFPAAVSHPLRDRCPLHFIDFNERMGPTSACFANVEWDMYTAFLEMEFGFVDLEITQMSESVLRSESWVVPGRPINPEGERPYDDLQGIPVLFVMVALRHPNNAEEQADFRRAAGMVHDAIIRMLDLVHPTRVNVGWALCIMGNGPAAASHSLSPRVAFQLGRTAQGFGMYLFQGPVPHVASPARDSYAAAESASEDDDVMASIVGNMSD
ncbi:hypothetical protein PG997_001667 [Apiospora hydei]|uniref:Uncharacterized protein n=1 Tax=Apiospora hydei TaxID=1337664 RepID=A0ABR1XEJ5_9PEZI